jgi:hypothetical protein
MGRRRQRCHRVRVRGWQHSLAPGILFVLDWCCAGSVGRFKPLISLQNVRTASAASDASWATARSFSVIPRHGHICILSLVILTLFCNRLMLPTSPACLSAPSPHPLSIAMTLLLLRLVSFCSHQAVQTTAFACTASRCNIEPSVQSPQYCGGEFMPLGGGQAVQSGGLCCVCSNVLSARHCGAPMLRR